MSAPRIKGWCPSAYHPMMSGDGLLVRIRPFLGRLSPDQVRGLSAAANRFGNGLIDLTTRANIQIRGVQPEGHAPLLDALLDLGLIDADATTEARRNIMVAPEWQSTDPTAAVYASIHARLTEMPDLPGKMGIALDLGPQPVLAHASADFRFEHRGDGQMILRADGSDLGRPVTSETAMDALLSLSEWFVATGGRDAGRMARHLRTCTLPNDWTQIKAAAPAKPLKPGSTRTGVVLGAPFGRLRASDLDALVHGANAHGVRLTPWRLFILDGAESADAHGADVITAADDPVLSASACPGAPFCEQAWQPTQDLARALARTQPMGASLHVSGCAKGCALRGAANTTLVGTKDGYDLVRHGTAWDEPTRVALSPDTIRKDLAG